MAETKSKDKAAQTAKKYAEDWLPVTDIRNGMIEVEGNALLGSGKQFVTGVRVEPKNIFISDSSQSLSSEKLSNIIGLLSSDLLFSFKKSLMANNDIPI